MNNENNNSNNKNNNPIFEISSKIGNTDASYDCIKHSKEGSSEGTNTLQDMINIELDGSK